MPSIGASNHAPSNLTEAREGPCQDSHGAIADLGIYHVMMRGCGKQIIFEDDLDRETFLRLAAAKLGSNDVLVLAWCLMDNHVHFLLEDLGRA